MIESYKEKPRQAPYRLTSFPFEPATLLAPMEGVTNPVMRAAIAANGGVGLLCTEFVRVTETTPSSNKLRKEVAKAEGFPLSVQVMGNRPDDLAETAGFFANNEADVVDINLGCPTGKATAGGVGAAMLKDPDLCYTVVCAMRKAVPGLLSAKIRAGYDNKNDVLTIAAALVAAGVDFITVHPRRATDMYEGRADWRIIGLLKENLRIPVVGNGDILCPADALKMEEQTGCDAVMIGRGAIRNPWIFRQLADVKAGREMFRPDGEVVWHWLNNFFDATHAASGGSRQQVLPRCKDTIKFIFQAIAGSDDVRMSCLRSQTVEEFLRHLERGVRALSADAFDYGLEGHPSQ